MHNVGPGWSFLTGKPADVELLRSKLGFVDLNPQVDENDRASHSGMIRFGNEPQAWWAACQGQANPEWIAREISYVIPERGVVGEGRRNYGEDLESEVQRLEAAGLV